MSAQQMSICPISDMYGDAWPGSKLPLRISDSLSIEDVSEVIQETAYNALVPLFYTEAQADTLKATRYAIVRRFSCREDDRPDEDERSASILYQLYLGLKVIRPTAGRYQALHYDLSQSAPRLPRGTRNDHMTIVCDYEILNNIRLTDANELVGLAAQVLIALQAAKDPIAQAVQSLEIGYRADFLNVRHLLWVVGLDALFTSTEWENRGKEVAIKRIMDFLGSDFEIYRGKQPRDYEAEPRLPKVTLSEVLTDIYELRNDFAHGTWPDKEWAGRVCRRTADGSRDIYYAEVLSEAASAILRGCLRRIFADPQLVAMFNEKPRMNAHFASRDLIRIRKKRA